MNLLNFIEYPIMTFSTTSEGPYDRIYNISCRQQHATTRYDKLQHATTSYNITTLQHYNITT
jgi:hypothetical protein